MPAFFAAIPIDDKLPVPLNAHPQKRRNIKLHNYVKQNCTTFGKNITTTKNVLNIEKTANAVYKLSSRMKKQPFPCY
jgi:hypothetical protein